MRKSKSINEKMQKNRLIITTFPSLNEHNSTSYAITTVYSWENAKQSQWIVFTRFTKQQNSHRLSHYQNTKRGIESETLDA